MIDVMVRMIKPNVGEKCNDPACGTFGFMIAADRYIKEKTNDLNDLSEEEKNFQINSAFSGCELVSETYRLALMNAILHGIHAKIYCGNTLTEEFGKKEELQNLDVVLSNPPFGTKKGGELTNRTDFMFATSNKQFNFLQQHEIIIKKKNPAEEYVLRDFFVIIVMLVQYGGKQKMIDFHSHILPGIDDGSKNTQMSLAMIEEEKKQGVHTIVATPHFYADEDSVERFLKRRAHSYERLQEEAQK